MSSVNNGRLMHAVFPGGIFDIAFHVIPYFIQNYISIMILVGFSGKALDEKIGKNAVAVFLDFQGLLFAV